MLRGVYSVANAMESASRNHEIAAENLANIDTPGYRRQGLIFDAAASSADSPADASSGGASARTPRSFQYTDGGPLQRTGNPYDLAVVGDAFFVLDGPDGPVYTRNGAFELSPTGQLQSRSTGYPLSGSVRIPRGTTQFNVGADGLVSANGQSLGQIRLASFAQPDALRRVGTTLFEGDDPQPARPGATSIQQGFREGSNVQPVQEMVSMMIGLRHYEAAQRALQALSEAVTQNTRPQQS